MIAFVVVLAFLIPDGPLRLDERWGQLMADAETSLLTHVALVFNAIGHGILRALTTAGIGLVLLIRNRRAALLAFILAEAMTPLLVNVIKLIVGRERPPGAMIEAHGSSYPSGHAAYAGATAVILVLLFTKPVKHRRAWWAGCGRCDRRDGLEPYLPSCALAVGRRRRGDPRRRRRTPQPRGRADPLDAMARRGRSAVPADRGECIVHIVVEVRVVERLEEAVTHDEIVQAAPELDEEHVHAVRIELLVESLEHVGGGHVDVGHRLALDDDPADVRLSGH